MERKQSTSSTQSQQAQANGQTEVMSIAQIQGLVRLLDGSDVSELEIKQANEGVHLVLRKVKAVEGALLNGTYVAATDEVAAPAEETGVGANQHIIVAPLVGVFHPWLKPSGGTLAAVGDHVKVGQLIGTIESLNVFNEVESTVAGRVFEVHVQDGQPVEYGQHLLTIDIIEVEES